MEKEEKRADQENDTEEQSTEAKSLLKKKLQYYSSEIQRDVGNLVKWLSASLLLESAHHQLLILTDCSYIGNFRVNTVL